MAKIYFILALTIQSYVFAADVNENTQPTNETKPTREDLILLTPGNDTEVFYEWMNLYPTSSIAMFTPLTNGSSVNCTAEEKIKSIQEMVAKITDLIKYDMNSLLEYTLRGTMEKCKDNSSDENSLRKKRETPMDSAQMVMRLLRHIKSNNDYQNYAIEKMMSAQEIADKYGIPFTPDTDVLTDFALATNKHAEELTTLLTEACDGKSKPAEDIHYVPLEEPKLKQNTGDMSYYFYDINQLEDMFSQPPPYEYVPETINRKTHVHHKPSFETQIMPPPHHHHNAPTTPKPTAYEYFMPETYQNVCPIEPITTTVVMPLEDIVEPKPKLVGEEYEETISSKVIVDHDELGCSTVNHVMTYTMSEKAHFSKPQIEKLPEQVQYTFFLM